MHNPKLVCVVGARPNFIKMAPILAAIQKTDPDLPVCLVHTGQHYDPQLSGSILAGLNMRNPDYELAVGSGSHSWQTAQIMMKFEEVVLKEKPTAIMVVGDVNSTLACALVAAKLRIPLIHVEAGLRSFDRSMPEEINRIICDQLSALLFTTEVSAKANLLQEGIVASHIHFVGNAMIDTLIQSIERAVPSQQTLMRLGLNPLEPYALVTLHRPNNVDEPVVLKRLMSSFQDLSLKIPVVFPCHPRTKCQIEKLGLVGSARLLLTESFDYLTLLGLLKDAKMVLTDSGGIQEEATVLNVPCLTLRYNTERPVTLTHGTNSIVGTESKAIEQKTNQILTSKAVSPHRVPPLWDGHASERLARILVPWLYEPTLLHRKKEELVHD